VTKTAKKKKYFTTLLQMLLSVKNVTKQKGILRALGAVVNASAATVGGSAAAGSGYFPN
jgi:hypothetical protein